MGFDRAASGSGVEVVCRLENSKAVLEWKFTYTDADRVEEGLAVRIRLLDKQGSLALECAQDPCEEEPLQSVLIQPHLWGGIRYPYLYYMEAMLVNRNGSCVDRICRQIPLRSIGKARGREEGLLLNDMPFTPRMVSYSFPSAASEAGVQRQMLEDLNMLLQAGANSIYIKDEREELVKLFLPLCDRLGFLVCMKEEMARKMDGGAEVPEKMWEDVPVFRGVRESLLLPGSKCPSSLFYWYKAKWSEEPFVYIVPESVRRLKSGNYSLVCYSNCSRVALYTDGILFEFQRGEGEFVFREFPAKGPCLMLTAEGDGCSESLSLHKTFIKHSD